MSIEGQGHFFTIYFPDFVCFVLYWAKISGERLQDHWSSGFKSVVYYVIPSVFAFERPSVRLSVHLSVLHVYKM